MKLGFAIAVGCLSVLAPVRASAQSAIPLSLEIRADAAVPIGGDFAEHAATAVGFGLNAAVQLIPNYAAYVGYSRARFGLDLPGAHAVDSGFSFGLTAAYPGLLPFTPWLGTGVLLHNLELRGTSTASGDSRVGFEVGGGVAVPLVARLRLTPGVGYRRYTARFVHGQNEPISYLTLGAGVNLAL